MPTALDVANYFLSIDEPENDVTDLKLQKLCAYAQAFSLAALERPLFEEDLQAWKDGPVVPSVYDVYCKYGREVIPQSGMSEKYAREPFDDEQKFILEIVKDRFFTKSAGELRRRSHNDFYAPWGSKKTIDKDAIQNSFLNYPFLVKLRNLPKPNLDTSNCVEVNEALRELGL